MEDSAAEQKESTVAETANEAETQQASSKHGAKRKAEWFETDTHVYVSGLPAHISEDEFVELMNKYGIISKKQEAGRPNNIKLYKNQDGSLKGDARCGYARKESADMAIEFLDGYLYDGKYELHCERAHFQMKGEYDPTRKPRLDKRAKINNKKKLDKLLSWEPEVVKEVQQKKVVLKNMFTPEEIIKDVELLEILKEDVEEMCEMQKWEAKRIDICDKHPEGVITVVFATPDQAEKCVKTLDKYKYAGKIISAELWDGKTKYKIKETDEEYQKRLEKWHDDLQKSDDEDTDQTKIPTSENKKECDNEAEKISEPESGKAADPT